MKCKNCKMSVFERPLTRINPKGEKGIFWCEPCLKEKEPELYNNLKEEESQLEKDLNSIIYNKE